MKMTSAQQLNLDTDIGKAIELLQKLQKTGEIGQVCLFAINLSIK